MASIDTDQEISASSEQDKSATGMRTSVSRKVGACSRTARHAVNCAE